jgi:cyclophilin family peptidyl-prolyl cis-trans isomerase
VAGHPASELGLSNTVGTVALALPGDGNGGTNRDAGSTSFFINMGNNSFLDSDFTVFASIADMTTVNKIMSLQTVDRTKDAGFGADPNNLGLTNVPVDGGFQVFIKRAFLITDTLVTTQDIAAVQSTLPQSANPNISGLSSSDLSALAASGAGGGGSPLGLSSASVPEPTTIGLMSLGALGVGCCSRRRRT